MDTISTLADVIRHLRMSKLMHTTGEHQLADAHIGRALEKLERVQAIYTGDPPPTDMPEYEQPNLGKVEIRHIQIEAAKHFNVKVSQLKSPSRYHAIVRPRQIAMFLCKSLTTNSFPEIGRHFGGRDHTTVMHATRKIEKLIKEDDDLRDDVESISKRVFEVGKKRLHTLEDTDG